MSSAAFQQAEARVGTVLKDRWHLDSLLGVGGMAWVYAATHRNRNRVAIKLLVPNLSHSEDIRRRFLREGYAANSIGHPGAVTVFDDDVTEDGLAFLVMELLEGKTLAQLRREAGGRLAPRTVMEHTDNILDVLVAAHAKGVIHRDIKPSNVFVTHDGHVKVVDFGIARVCESGQDLESTHSGMLLGSAPFMPPEQARGRWELVDARSDVWSIGATMFQLIAGRAVHEASTPQERLLAAMSAPARSLSSLLPNLPKDVVELVDRALAFDRDQRWQSAGEMQAALRRALRGRVGLGGTVILGAPPPEISSPSHPLPVLAPPEPPSASDSALASSPRPAPALGETRVFGTPADSAPGSGQLPMAAAAPLSTTSTYGSPPAHSKALPPIPAPANLMSGSPDSRPASDPFFTPPPAAAPEGPTTAPREPSRPRPAAIIARFPAAPSEDSQGAGTAAAGAMTRDRAHGSGKRSRVLVAGVALLTAGAALLALAAVGLWRLERESKSPPAQATPPTLAAETPSPPTPPEASASAAPADPSAAPPVAENAPEPGASATTTSSGPGTRVPEPTLPGGRPAHKTKAPKADSYR